MAKRLKLRMTDGQKHVEFETDLSTVTYQIVHDTTEMLGPDVLAKHENTWVPLKDFPEAPWLDELATCAVEALRAGDIDTCEGAADRILCFAGSRECEAVCIGHLLEGHFRFVEGRLYDAISNWELAARSRSQVKSVACSNLGAAFALARNPSRRWNPWTGQLP